jgi:4Fe-4S single cluster domain of Ferredoxin I
MATVFYLLSAWLLFGSILQTNGFSTPGQYTQRSKHLSMAIAPYKKPRSQNAPGNLFVDEGIGLVEIYLLKARRKLICYATFHLKMTTGCIDCDVCRWMCPSIYARKGIKSAVINQPIKEVSYTSLR